MRVPRTDVTVLDQRLPLRLAKRSPRRRQPGRCRNSSRATALRAPERAPARPQERQPRVLAALALTVHLQPVPRLLLRRQPGCLRGCGRCLLYASSSSSTEGADHVALGYRMQQSADRAADPRGFVRGGSVLARRQLAPAPPSAEEQGPRTDRSRRETDDGAAGLARGEIRDCDSPPVKTCFAVGAVLRVCEVFRFLLEHQSLGVTLVLLLLVPAGSVISRRVLLHGRDEAGAVSIFAVEVSIACAA